ncbi:MAG: hypothetical protein AAB850_01795 [Patescibacteria group bacterium]
MVKIREYIAQHRPPVVLMAIVLLLTTVPVFETAFVIGDAWLGILPPITDGIYDARVQTIGEGHFTGGNAFYLEHSDDPPLVIFAGAWINATPLLIGVPFVTAMVVNFIIWSLLFAITAYLLLRELRVSSWIAVFGTLFLYVQSYGHVLRPVNLQTVYPFYFLFYLFLLRLIREQSRKNIILLGLVAGATFYFYSYLWQTVVITLGILFLYALARRNWPLLKATLLSSLLGGIIGLPVLLYALWLSLASPYFWESVGRLGLVNTHLPMAEVIYSGGWIGIVCAFLAILFWRARTLRENKEFILLGSFLAISGFGLWVMEGSNLITGKLLETGEHMPGLIFPWLIVALVSLGTFVWRNRVQLSSGLRVLATCTFLVLLIVNIRYGYAHLGQFLPPYVDRTIWQANEQYAKPLAWLQDKEKNPVVVWSNPSYITTLLPTYTRHFSLQTYWGMLELLPDGEVRERYLITQYFNNPTVSDLKNNMESYLGRQDTAHIAKTIERGIKICRILFFWDRTKNCGIPPTPQQLLGEKFFIDLEAKFQTDIKPNIKAYLKKYHVLYMLKDKTLDSTYHPETLGAVLVYTDGRFELYKMQY